MVEGMTKKGFLLSCSYKGQECTDPKLVEIGIHYHNDNFFNRFWTMFTTPTYGNCFTFNSGMNLNTDVKRVTVTGSRNGLDLELYLDQKNYMYNKLSRKAGARITINDP